jgi:prephenate dehydratase
MVMESSNSKFHTLGPSGSFHHLAFQHHYGQEEIQLHDSFEQIFTATAIAGKGWIAVRNSIAGLVENNQLIIDQSFNKISSNNFLVKLCLTSLNDTPIENLKQVWSHPKALQECLPFLNSNLPTALWKEFNSTSAAAAKLLAQQKSDVAVICAKKTAQQYNLTIIKEDIHSSNRNFTEFILFEKRK